MLVQKDIVVDMPNRKNTGGESKISSVEVEALVLWRAMMHADYLTHDSCEDRSV